MQVRFTSLLHIMFTVSEHTIAVEPDNGLADAPGDVECNTDRPHITIYDDIILRNTPAIGQHRLSGEQM